MLAERLLNNGEVVVEGEPDASDVINGAAAVYCPDGSPEPVVASPGYYTTGAYTGTRAPFAGRLLGMAPSSHSTFSASRTLPQVATRG